METYDIAIIGTGPAGISAQDEFLHSETRVAYVRRMAYE